MAAKENAMRKRNPHNFVRVHQHCRGTGKSGGDFIPYVNERADGLALLEWIRKQDFYNGEIYLEGSSYGSSVHAALLNTKQPDIKGVSWKVQDTERYNIIYRNGFLRLRLHASWYLGVYKKNAAIKRDSSSGRLILGSTTIHRFTAENGELPPEWILPVSCIVNTAPCRLLPENSKLKMVTLKRQKI